MKENDGLRRSLSSKFGRIGKIGSNLSKIWWNYSYDVSASSIFTLPRPQFAMDDFPGFWRYWSGIAAGKFTLGDRGHTRFGLLHKLRFKPGGRAGALLDR